MALSLDARNYQGSLNRTRAVHTPNLPCLATHSLVQGKLDEAKHLCIEDKQRREALDPFFNPPQIQLINQAGLEILTAFTLSIEDNGFRKNYLIEIAACYLDRGNYPKALEILGLSQKPVDDVLNQLLTLKPQYVAKARGFAQSLSDLSLRMHCLRLCELRVNP